MTLKRLVSAVSALMLTATCLTANAKGDLIVSIDWDPIATGSQSGISVSAGSRITADLVFELTGSTSLSSYGFSLRFDTDELDFVSRVETPPTGFVELDNSNPSTENAGAGFGPMGNYGELLRIDGENLGTGISAPGSFVVASVTFDAIGPTGDFSDVDLLAGNFETLFDGFFDNNGDDLLAAGLVQFQSGSVSLSSVSSVPEPGSISLVTIATVFILAKKYRRVRARK